MPVRLTEDDRPESNNNTNNNKGGGYGWWAIIGFLFIALKKWPKTTLTFLAIFAVLYFIGSSEETSIDETNSNSLGCKMEQSVFDKAEVFEPLDLTRNKLPRSISLEKFAPTRMSQGQQGSCVGWASAYAARTILEAAATGMNPNSIAFSPSFLYNQIGLRDCNGAYIQEAMEFMNQKGALPFAEFPYDENSCSTQPTPSQLSSGNRYTIPGFNRLTQSGEDYTVDINAIKQNIASGAPVVIGMKVGGSFESNNMYGSDQWEPTRTDYNNFENFGGHAMCVIGYDDDKHGGSFQIMNSWGKNWGDNGLFWMNYKDFSSFTREAYGLYPMKRNTPESNSTIALNIGLVDNATNNYISIRKNGKTFKTTNSLSAGTRFKIEVNNQEPCYTYILGQETDQSSYILFPYTKKHSPYCGVVGARLFPKFESLELDNLGNKDVMAIIISKNPLDYQKINSNANQSESKNYYQMLKSALKKNIIEAEFLLNNNTIQINEKDAEDGAILIVLEINKN